MKFDRRARISLSFAAVFASLGAQASTVVFDSLNDKATFVYSGSVGGANLSATVTYELTSWTGPFATFHVASTNNSTGLGFGLNPNRLVAIGVAVVNPDLVSAVVPGITEWDATVNTNFPPYGVVELCNYAGPECAGGAGLGTFVGTTDELDLTLRFVSAVGASNPISFSSPFTSRWQAVGLGFDSYTLEGCLQGDPTCSPGPPRRLAEPGSLAMVALALLATAGLSRRRA
jgi:hypothetical protein